MDTLRQDLLYAFRHLRKSPGYAVVTVLTLALGIGATGAIFSVVNGVLLKPLPYPDPGRLVFITSQFPALGFDQFWVSAPEFIEFRERNKSFQEVGAYRAGAVNLGTDDQPRRVNSAIVTSELMPVLGVQPLRGRQFTREDTLPGAEDVAVLSQEAWESAFASDESVIGRVVRVDGVPTRIVGIMPAGYDIHDARVQVWLPLTLDPASPGNRGGHVLYLVGRLSPGVSLTQARADLERMLTQWPQLNPKTHVPNTQGHRLRFDGLQEDLVGGIATALWVLQGAVVFVLLIACANLANLLLARAESRQKEFAIRSALGADRLRLLRQFLTEGVALSLLGGVLGGALGFAALRALLAANPDSVPRSAGISPDPSVLLFTLLVSILTGLFLAQLLGFFAGLALLLAAIGTYGILSYSVSERRKEIGIHMALGATRGTVLGMVFRQGVKLTLAGLTVGFAGSLALTRFLQTQLFDVQPTDPATIVAVMAFITCVAALACYLPASRATRVDPMVVLRDEYGPAWQSAGRHGRCYVTESG